MTWTPPFTWQDYPSTASPLSAANLIAQLASLASYADTVAAGGTELANGYVQGTSSFSLANTTVVTDITGMSVTVTTTTSPIIVEFFAPSVSTNVGGFGSGVLFNVDGTDKGPAAALVSGSQFVPMIAKQRLSLSAGSHTIKARAANNVNTGTLTIAAANGTYPNNVPMYLRVCRA